MVCTAKSGETHSVSTATGWMSAAAEPNPIIATSIMASEILLKKASGLVMLIWLIANLYQIFTRFLHQQQSPTHEALQQSRSQRYGSPNVVSGRDGSDWISRDGQATGRQTRTYRFGEGNDRCSGSGKCEVCRSSHPSIRQSIITSTTRETSGAEQDSKSSETQPFSNGAGFSLPKHKS